MADEQPTTPPAEDPAAPPAEDPAGVVPEAEEAAAADALLGETAPDEPAADDDPAAAPAAAAPAPAADEPDYQDLYLRARAEMDNVRKRARRDAGLAEARGVGRLARELLPALDNYDRALAAAEHSGESELTKGLRLVQQELAGALTRVGIVQDTPRGEPFDPHRHEALAQQPVEGTATGTIVEVYQPGYHLEDVVLRAAKVVVAA